MACINDSAQSRINYVLDGSCCGYSFIEGLARNLQAAFRWASQCTRNLRSSLPVSDGDVSVRNGLRGYSEHDRDKPSK